MLKSLVRDENYAKSWKFWDGLCSLMEDMLRFGRKYKVRCGDRFGLTVEYVVGSEWA